MGRQRYREPSIKSQIRNIILIIKNKIRNKLIKEKKEKKKKTYFSKITINPPLITLLW